MTTTPRSRTAHDRRGDSALDERQATAPGDAPAQAGDWRMKALVFLAGGVLMGLEIAGARLLAPYFGSSVFVWGSLITVFLLALSVGNFVGGHLADRHPSRLLLAAICVVVSLWLVALAFAGHGVCQSLVAMGLGERSGPPVAAGLLFLPPSVGLGAVSPFAIRIATPSLISVGRVAGAIYALSSVGSIVGTILTTFVLIPLILLSSILKGLGVTLLLAALFTMRWSRNTAGLAVAGVAAIAGLGLALAASPPQYELSLAEEIVVDESSPYHNILVIDNHDELSRALRFDRYTESKVSLVPPHRSLVEYTEYFQLVFLLNPDVRRALFIGAGGGVGPRCYLMHRPDMTIDVVDVDQKILDISREYFFFTPSAHTRLIAEDGRLFVRRAEGSYDAILLDAFTIGGRIPFHLATREFFELCRDRLADDGVFMMNVNSALSGPYSEIFRSIYATLRQVFPQVYVFVANYGRTHDALRSANILLLATKSPERLAPDQWQARAAAYQSPSYVDRRRVQQMVADLITAPVDVAGAHVLTDDYAPIESMTF